MGAYPTRANNAFSEWYAKDDKGHTILHIPARFGDGGMKNKSIALRPIRDEIITGQIQGRIEGDTFRSRIHHQGSLNAESQAAGLDGIVPLADPDIHQASFEVADDGLDMTKQPSAFLRV